MPTDLLVAFVLLGGLIVMTAVYWLFRRASPVKTKKTFRVLQILSSAFMAFSHGSNDGQKFMGILRSHFVIDESGKVVQVEYNVAPAESAQKAMAALG